MKTPVINPTVQKHTSLMIVITGI